MVSGNGRASHAGLAVGCATFPGAHGETPAEPGPAAQSRLRASDFVAGGVATPLPPEVLRAYDAPFPSEEHSAGLRQMTALLPLTRNDVGAAIGRRTMAFLGEWERPFLTCYSDGDPATRGWETVFGDHVPGARGLPHRTLAGAGHFLQEDAGERLGEVVAALMKRV